MSDLMREEFETWWSSTPILGENKRTIAEKAWKAYRECLVIELPNRFDEKYQDYYDDVEGGCFNEGRYINDVHATLTAAGVKYK